MKKTLAILMVIILAFSLVACTVPNKNDNTGNQQGSLDQGTQNGGNIPTDATEPTQTVQPTETRQPDEAFSPYGTWVWVGNDKFTLTLNEDGSAVYTDTSDNSYINLYPRLQELYFSASNTFTFDESTQKLVVNLLLDDRNATEELTVGIGNGYYILDGGPHDYCFVRLENYQEANTNFLNAPVYFRWAGETYTQIGETTDLFPDNEVKFTINKIELNSEYQAKFYCTISAVKGVTSFDWIEWTLYAKGESGIRNDRVYFYDMNGNEVNGLSDGQTLEGYFIIENVASEKSMTWFRELQAGIYISGMYSGIGCRVILPTKPNV